MTLLFPVAESPITTTLYMHFCFPVDAFIQVIDMKSRRYLVMHSKFLSLYLEHRHRYRKFRASSTSRYTYPASKGAGDQLNTVNLEIQRGQRWVIGIHVHVDL